ncbi:DUF4422 domain-containing protein [Oribacterium sp. P6A1]|uniref:DUF4422 domain-containing protein n=1 Tax=Oribacterium sp. P6A1 TaxID=1410612 RepID=UPI0006911754|nr:DUF4422 domain-containing protein [Oribacterium sp. P6A1]
MVADEVLKNKKYVIYGAQVIAFGAYKALMNLTGISPECFAVGKSKGKPTYPLGNPEDIEGIPVRPIEEISKEMFIIVGVTEMIQKEVLPFLAENGYKHVFPLIQHEEHLLMSEYYRRLGLFPTIEKLSVINESTKRQPDFMLYEVKNDRDKPLSCFPQLYSYEKTIQAGAAIAEKSIADIRDDAGINISEKNRMYCEMSAVYWIWKNTDHDWIGIEHYRRHFLVKPEMLRDDIDVFLPLPYMCYPHEMKHVLRFTTEKVMYALLETLKVLYPDKYEEYRKILYGQYQYCYNIICARRYVFDNYCRWLFGITEYMEKNFAEEVTDLMTTRTLGYVSEVLTSVYYMSHQHDLRIMHVEKEFYV